MRQCCRQVFLNIAAANDEVSSPAWPPSVSQLVEDDEEGDGCGDASKTGPKPVEDEGL